MKVIDRYDTRKSKNQKSNYTTLYQKKEFNEMKQLHKENKLAFYLVVMIILIVSSTVNTASAQGCHPELPAPLYYNMPRPEAERLLLGYNPQMWVVKKGPTVTGLEGERTLLSVSPFGGKHGTRYHVYRVEGAYAMFVDGGLREYGQIVAIKLVDLGSEFGPECSGCILPWVANKMKSTVDALIAEVRSHPCWVFHSNRIGPMDDTFYSHYYSSSDSTSTYCPTLRRISYARDRARNKSNQDVYLIHIIDAIVFQEARRDR
jgi:hypothetical protein